MKIKNILLMLAVYCVCAMIGLLVLRSAPTPMLLAAALAVCLIAIGAILTGASRER